MEKFNASKKKLSVYPYLKVFVLLVACCLASESVASQSIADLRQQQSMQEIRISVDFDNTPLDEALMEIGQKSGIAINYNASLFREDRFTSFKADSLSLEAILEAVLPPSVGFKRMDGNVILQKKAAFLVSGRVTDASREDALPGVNIAVKGTTIGTSTASDGSYSLTTPSAGDTLIFSFIGYQTEEIAIQGRSEIDVALQSEAIAGEEVVVVGYGTEKKIDLTGSVSTIDGAELAQKNTTQLSQSLQGSVPGVMVRRSSSMPGASADIKIRGITTIGNSDPLIIVDGVPHENIDDINPNDIEQMTVLKDASAASIYGARAASGVILISTKNAEVGETNFEVSSNIKIQRPTAWPETVGPIRYMEMFNEIGWNDAGNPENGEYATFSRDEINNWIERHSTNPDEYPLTDWQDLLMDDYAPSQGHQLTMSHGSEIIQTRASIKYQKDEALYDYRNYERIMTSLNNNITFTDYLSSKVNLSYNRSISENPSRNPLRASYQYPDIYGAVYEDGRIARSKDGSNTYAALHEGGFHDKSNNKFNGRISLEFNPLEELTITGVVAPSYKTFYEKDFDKQIPYTDPGDPNQIVGYIGGFTETSLSEYRMNHRTLTKQLLVNYQDSFADNHNIDFLAGYEDYSRHRETFVGTSAGLQVHEFPYMDTANQDNLGITGAANEYAYRSLFGRLNYNFNSTYYIQGNMRVDGSSRFHPDHRWGYFPSFSAGWVISNESFMSGIQPLSFLKLRGSVGNLGNERIGLYPYQASVNLTTNPLFWKGNDIISRISAAQVSYDVRDISWETTQAWDIGIDMNLFDDRLEMVFDYYQKDTRDMLLNLEIPNYMGYGNPDQNAGTMTTKGWELQLGWQDQVGEFSYSVRANLSDFISTMGNLKGTQFLGDQIIREDSEYNEWYGYLSDGIFQTEEEVGNSPVLNSATKAGDIKYVDISGPDGEPDGRITPEHDKKLLGGSLPRYIYGGNIDFNYKNVGFSVTVQGIGKQTRRMTRRMVEPLEGWWLSPPKIIENNYWSHYNSEAENRDAEFPRLTWANADENYAMSDYWLFDGSYFRLKNISLSYTIPAKFTERISVSKLTIYSNISDLFSIDNFPEGWDPEMSGNSYISQTYTFGVNINF